jgi:hypothetical protein
MKGKRLPQYYLFMQEYGRQCKLIAEMIAKQNFCMNKPDYCTKETWLHINLYII